MDREHAYIYLDHMRVMLERGNVAALSLDDDGQRQHYLNAIRVVLPLLETSGVMVDESAHLAN